MVACLYHSYAQKCLSKILRSGKRRKRADILLKKIWGTVKKLIHNKVIGLFLLSYFFYIDGVDTIIKLSTTYGQSVGLETNGMIVALLVTQLVAFPAVLLLCQDC